MEMQKINPPLDIEDGIKFVNSLVKDFQFKEKI